MNSACVRLTGVFDFAMFVCSVVSVPHRIENTTQVASKCLLGGCRGTFFNYCGVLKELGSSPSRLVCAAIRCCLVLSCWCALRVPDDSRWSLSPLLHQLLTPLEMLTHAQYLLPLHLSWAGSGRVSAHVRSSSSGQFEVGASLEEGRDGSRWTRLLRIGNRV